MTKQELKSENRQLKHALKKCVELLIAAGEELAVEREKVQSIRNKLTDVIARLSKKPETK